MDAEISAYNDALAPSHKAVCDSLATEIDRGLPSAECKIWHAHPVWFLDGNPIVGYSKQKGGCAFDVLERCRLRRSWFECRR